MKPIVTWIVTADGGRVRVFENRGPGKGLVPVAGLTVEDAHLRTRDINADRPGRTASQGHVSAMEPPSDAAAQREQAFARAVAETLHQRFAGGAFSRLIIAAAPTALGHLRTALGPALDGAIVAEVHKDLTKVPLADLGAHFKDLLAM